MFDLPHPEAQLKIYGDLEVWEWRVDGVRKLELTGAGVLEEYQADALRGDFVDADHYSIILAEDCDVYKPRGEDILAMFDGEGSEEDRLLISFRKGVIPLELAAEAGELMRSAATKSDNRGLAGGPIDVRKLRTNAQGGNLIHHGKTRVNYRLPDGSVGATCIANKVRSGIAGNFDKDMRHPFCRQTTWSKANPGKTLKVFPFLEAVSECFRNQAPVRWQRQKDFISENQIADHEWSLGRTVFTTLTVNQNFRTATHKDSGDFPGGYGNLSVFEGKPYTGGYTGLPQFKVAVDVRTGDFLAMDVHEWHANTEMFPVDEPPEGEEWDDLDNRGFERISFVCYVREKMARCGTRDEEAALHAAWYAKYLTPKRKAAQNKLKRDANAILEQEELDALREMMEYEPGE